jgi:hypothetical protein
MKKMGGGFGLVMLVVVMAVVLLLVAKQWKAVAPTAMQLDDGTPMVVPETHGEDAAGEALQRGGLPDLNQMRQATGQHAQEVQETLEEVE